ncbi:MAG: hypothetical protein JEZ09_17715 [Salinivirgaceae bacterium]|nr:hypothetical protein [Salinivirgaceae bacterium]
MSKKVDIKNKLPKHIAPDCVWTKIATHLDYLDNQNNNSRLATKLPTHTAPDIFAKIQVEKRSKTKFISYRNAAAAILILVSTSIGITTYLVKNNANIAHTIEMEPESTTNTNIFNFQTSNEFSYILSQSCNAQPEVCNKPEYENLQKQLNDIEKEIETLKQALSTYKDPNLEKHLVRLINDKVKLEKYLLNLFS